VPDLIFSVEVVVGLLVALIAAYVLVMVGRRRAIGRGRVLTMCAVQADGARTWRSGFVRFGDGVVEWYPLGGISLRPKHTWDRADLDVSAARPVATGEGPDVIKDAVRIDCRHNGENFGLALSAPAYTALRSWLESAPPGPTASVT
jgi:hypothetical protein